MEYFGFEKCLEIPAPQNYGGQITNYFVDAIAEYLKKNDCPDIKYTYLKFDGVDELAIISRTAEPSMHDEFLKSASGAYYCQYERCFYIYVGGFYYFMNF